MRKKGETEWKERADRKNLAKGKILNNGTEFNEIYFNKRTKGNELREYRTKISMMPFDCIKRSQSL